VEEKSYFTRYNHQTKNLCLINFEMGNFSTHKTFMSFAFIDLLSNRFLDQLVTEKTNPSIQHNFSKSTRSLYIDIETLGFH